MYCAFKVVAIYCIKLYQHLQLNHSSEFESHTSVCPRGRVTDGCAFIRHRLTCSTVLLVLYHAYVCVIQFL
jgi:hypothetical protein